MDGAAALPRNTSSTATHSGPRGAGSAGAVTGRDLAVLSIPTPHALISSSLPRAELLEVVRRVAVLAQRNSPLRLRFAEGELTVSARTQDVGEASESLPVAYTGEPLEIGFNAEFLRDGLDSVTGDELVLKLISPLRPAVMVSPGDDFTYLIMPIRLAG